MAAKNKAALAILFPKKSGSPEDVSSDETGESPDLSAEAGDVYDAIKSDDREAFIAAMQAFAAASEPPGMD